MLPIMLGGRLLGNAVSLRSFVIETRVVCMGLPVIVCRNRLRNSIPQPTTNWWCAGNGGWGCSICPADSTVVACSVVAIVSPVPGVAVAGL